MGALEVPGLEVRGARDPARIRLEAEERENLLEAVLQGLPHVLIVDDQQPLVGVVLQPVGVEVEPGGRLDLDKLLPASSDKLVDLRQASVASTMTAKGYRDPLKTVVWSPVKVPVSNYGLIGISYQQNGGVVHLRVVVESNLM